MPIRTARTFALVAIFAIVAGCATGAPGGETTPPGAATTPTPTATQTSADPAATTSAPAATASPAHPFAGRPDWIAYQTDRGGEGTWLIHPDGTGDHQIAADFDGSLILPSWSPDGQKIAMTSRETGGTEPIFAYDVVSDEISQLFQCEDPCIGDDEPAWSPDGSTVAVVRALGPFTDGRPSDCALWLGDVATETIRQLTSTPGCANRETLPQWSPDGRKLVYYRGTYDDSGTTATTLYVLDVASRKETQLTDPSLFAGATTWSPDGEWIVFDTYPLNDFQCCEVSNLYRIRPDGSGIEQLTDYPTAELRATQPRFSPDGEWLVFTAVTPSSRELWIMPATGGEPVVVRTGGIHTHGTWQPTG